MGKGPGFFSDLGSRGRDVMSKGYDNGVHVNVARSNLSDGNNNFYSGALTGNSFSFGVETGIKKINTNIALNVDKITGVFATVLVDKVIPGVKTFFKFNPMRQNLGKIEFWYQDKYVGINSSSNLSLKPLVNFSGILSTKLPNARKTNFHDDYRLWIGADCAIDTATNNFTKLNIGLQTSSDCLRFGVLKNLTVGHATLTWCQDISPYTRGCIELFRYLDSPFLLNSSAIGIEHKLSKRTKIKARMDDRGDIKVAMTQRWEPNSSITISGEFNDRPGGLMRAFKFGMSMDLMLH